MDATDTVPDICVEVGDRLRRARQAKGMTLDDVELASDGRWSASAVGAYERGSRILNVPRLVELAAWFDVPVTALLGQPEYTTSERVLSFDLKAPTLVVADRLAGLRSFLRAVAHQRGDYCGRVLTLRGSDLPAVTTLVGADSAAAAVEFLDGLGVLVKAVTS